MAYTKEDYILLKDYYNSNKHMFGNDSFDTIDEKYKESIINTLGFAAFRTGKAIEALGESLTDNVLKKLVKLSKYHK